MLQLKLCQGSRSMSTLCQGYVKGAGPCWHWLPLFDVKHIFCILFIKSESMSTLCQWSIIHVYVMSREILSMSMFCQGHVKGGGPCRGWLPLFDVNIYFIFYYVHVDVMSREVYIMYMCICIYGSMSKLSCNGTP